MDATMREIALRPAFSVSGCPSSSTGAGCRSGSGGPDESPGSLRVAGRFVGR
jgi:hypothetical protein